MRFALVVLAVSISAAVPARARTWQVPAGAPTIHAGIDSAAAGDTVSVDCGVYLEHGILMKSGVVLRGASADSTCVTIDGEFLGRAIECSGVSSVVIQGLTILHGGLPVTPETRGGGIWVHGNGSFRITSCVFEDDRATYLGGGVSTDNASGVIEDCVFRDDKEAYTTSGGGGGLAVGSGAATVSRCLFTGNSTRAGGGGLLCLGTTTQVTVSDCVFESNVAQGAGGGGAEARGASTRFERCRFVGNSSGRGGGALCSGTPSPTFESCIFTDNFVIGDGIEQGGGAVYSSSSAPYFHQCTMARNVSNNRGAALYSTGTPTPTCANTIMAFGTRGQAVFVYLISPPPTLSCCDLFGNEYGDWVGRVADQMGVRANFTADPLFCDPAGAVWTLRPGSPCAPPGITGCGLVGALTVGCTTSAPPTNELSTWGRLKGAYRP